MSRSSLTAACIFALILILIRAETTRSSYMWTPAVQISNTPFGCSPNVRPSWSKSGSRRIHHILRECVRPNAQACNGNGAVGWYIEVGPDLDSLAWVDAWDSRHLLTGVQSEGDSLRGQDFDMVVDRDDDVHVVFEAFRHQAYSWDPGLPASGYKQKSQRSWDSDTSVVLSDSLTAGTVLCNRRDHGPQLFLERSGSADSIHVAVPYDEGELVDCTDFDHWMIHMKKAVDTPDTDWPKETFATTGFAKHLADSGTTMTGAGIRTLLRDANGTMHMWGKQLLLGQAGQEDTLLWRHFWGSPGQPGGAWQDTASRVLLKDYQAPGAQGRETGGEPEGTDWVVEENDKLYFLWREVGGPVFIHRVDVDPPYPDSTELDVTNRRQLTPSGVNAHDMQLLRTDDGVWHLIWAAKPDPGALDQIWHKYVTTPAPQDPFDATSETPDTPDDWSVPSLVTVDFVDGPKDFQRGWFVAVHDTTWMTFTAWDADADSTNEAWFRRGFPIDSDSVLTGKETWEGLVSLDADFYVAPNCTLEIKPGTMVVAADSTDRLAGGKNPNLIELIVQGTLLADGTAAEPIEFRGVDTTATNGWYGIRMDLIGTTWTGYGYIGSEEPLSSISHATIRDAARGISVENLIAPNLADVQFKNIGGSPAKHIYLDSADVVLPYGVWDRSGPDSTHHIDALPGVWDLLGKTNVIAANASQQDAAYGVAGKVDLLVQGKIFTTGSTAQGDTVTFRPETRNDATAEDWGGLFLDGSAFGGSVIEYGDIGHAKNPLYIFYPDSLTTLRNSRVHHFKDIGVWVDGAVGLGGVIQSNTIERGSGLGLALGKTGLFLDQSDELRVLNNKIDLTGISGSTIVTSAVEVYFGKTMCDAQAVEDDTLRIAGNYVIGPGAATQGTFTGIKTNWICGSAERTNEIVANYITGFGFAGLEFLQTEDVRADSNNVVNSYRGVEVSRDTTVVGPAVRFKANWLEVRDPTSGLEAVRTNHKEKTKLGNGAAGRGHNGFMVLDQNVKFLREEDPYAGVSVKLDARDCYWYLVDSQGATDFLSTSEEQATKINPRLVPDPAGGENHFLISPIQTSDTNPTYFKMSGPPQVGRNMAGPEVVSAEDDHGGALVADLGAIVPDRTSLGPPFANPMRGEAEIVLAVAPESVGAFRVEVFEVTGRRVAVLLEGPLSAGFHRIRWNGTSSSGQRVAAGTYFVRAEGPAFRTTKKLVLVK